MNKRILVSLMILTSLQVNAISFKTLMRHGVQAATGANRAVQHIADRTATVARTIYRYSNPITVPAAATAICWITLLAAQATSSQNWSISTPNGMLVAVVGMTTAVVTFSNICEAIREKFGFKAKDLVIGGLGIIALLKMSNANYVPNPFEVAKYVINKVS